MHERRVCASPACRCETPYRFCSRWCALLDIPAGVRCLCGHDECLFRPARGAPWSPTADGRLHRAARALVVRDLRVRTEAIGRYPDLAAPSLSR
jgi:hypothetical protein